ncbi:hypothetical protein C7S18_01180 [Ahniella affigens]|uniref:Uncharacterized protein n=1 Tax=Ahniella affigens TaxID=2021234 RepID=A0A2P1PM23_9GAMM|nr:hypothetical protein C7S18_01180 [Ahniella affigens]
MLAAILLLWLDSVPAATLTITPAKASQGATIRVVSSGLAPSTSYQLEFVGSPATNIGTAITTDPRGSLSRSIVLPALPVGIGKMRLKTTGGTVAAYNSFTVLSSLNLTPLTTNPSAGQSFRFAVSGLTAGNLTVLYEEASVLGPVVVSDGSFSGKFILPTNRPANLPGPARILLINRVGKAIVSQREFTINVGAKPPSPFTVSIVTPPPNQALPSKPLRSVGQINVAANEPAPESTTMWFTGDDGRVFPLAEAPVRRVGNQYEYEIVGASPGAFSMSAGPSRHGSLMFTQDSTNAHGLMVRQFTAANNANLNAIPEDYRQLTVRVVRMDGTPIPGAVVQVEGAPVTDADDLDGPSWGSIMQNLQQMGLANQLGQFMFRLTDVYGCPITLERQLSGNTGRAEFLFANQDLMIASIPRFYCGPTGCHPLGDRGLSLAINASAQGYGFQFPPGQPNEYDFLPHRYNVFFTGMETDDTSDDTTRIVDWYQNVEMASGGRNLTYTLPLPPILRKVVLYDLAAKPWIANGVRNQANASEGFAEVTQQFGPINSQLGVNPAWISEALGQGYPTELTVRTDPAITGEVASAKLFLDLDRNGSYEYQRNFSSSGAALDCSIDGLDTSLTWRAQLPNVRQQSAGLIKGYAEFVGDDQAGSVKQKITVSMVQRDLSWLNASRIDGQSVVYGAGGQNMRITAEEDNGDADIQLDQSPGYQIGTLRNRTENVRMLDLFIAADGAQTTFAPVNSNHRSAGRAGSPTAFEAPIGQQLSEHYTLIDNSFPLFYYVWGVPLLAGIEVGANFNILAEIDIAGKTTIANNGQPKLNMTTTPSLDMGLNFYLDIDVLFDLVDGGVDLDAVFALDMPVTVDPSANPVVRVEECFTALLLFSWHFEVFCLPLDLICDALNDISGSEVLLSDQVGNGCNTSPVPNSGLLAGKFDGLQGLPGQRPSARIQPRQSVTAYSPVGSGLMAFTRADPTMQTVPKLVVRPIDGGDFGRSQDEVVLSTAPGIRSIDLAFYNDSHAVMVWAENADSYQTMAALSPLARLARQRLMYATWDGETWSSKTALTPVSGGEGGVDLASCPDGEAGCPSGGEVFAVWTRDMAGNMSQHRSRIYHAAFVPSRGGFSTPQAVDSSASAMLDTAPSAAYVDGERAVAFVRSSNGVFSDTDARRIAYRLMDSTGVQVPGGLPGGVAWPSIVGDGSGGFMIAHTYADDPDMFVGNKQRVALARGQNCVAGVCTVTARALTDTFGRAIYGERPQALRDDAGNYTVVMRGTGFGNDAQGSNTRDGDPIGMAMHTGDLIALNVTANSNAVTPLPLTADGGGHFAPHAAMDPSTGQYVVLGTRGLPLPFLTQNQYRDAQKSAAVGKAVQGNIDADLSVYSMASEPDLRVEEVALNLGALQSGTAFTATAKVRSIGANFVVSPVAPTRIVWSWDAPLDEGGTLIGSRNLTSMASGDLANFSFNATVPTGFKPEQPHRLYARLLIGNAPFTDGDLGNNDASISLGGMPLVQGLNANALVGTTLVQLSWDAPIDPLNLVEGFRIWCHDGDGQWRHLGSSFERGFLDLGAPLGVTRHYRVSSYAKSTLESPPSDSVTAMATLGDAMFSSSFE